jgi:polysaccharide pyruvyl transferase WcaK-like protein
VYLISNLIRQGYSIVLFATDVPDRKVIHDIFNSLTKACSLNIHERIRQARTETIGDLVLELLKVDYVVASRLHGVLLAHLLCIPVLAISYDRKVDTHMADIGLFDYCMDIHRLEIASPIEKFEALTANADRIRSILKERTDDYKRALERQYDFVLENKLI